MEPELLTKQEKDKIYEKVSSKMSKQLIEVDFGTSHFDRLFNATVNLVIKRLERLRNEISIQHGVPADQIKVDHKWSVVRFYMKREETDKEFSIRVEKEVKSEISRIEGLRRKKLIELSKQKEKDKKELARIIANLGPEIYEVFEEIKKQNP